MNKLIITELEFQNFLSYGDYKTSMAMSGLGPVLIVGDKSDERGDYSKSNGAGKSTITTAILWALFGRTFSLAKPGDKVVNWFTDKNCYVRIKTADGWEITRTRKMEGYNELAVTHNGDDKTLSTLSNTEEFIHKYFGLDFDIFTSSVFFGQFSKSFLELNDQKRRAALEKLLNLDKLNGWAEVAKIKLDRTNGELTKCVAKIEPTDNEIARLNSQKAAVAELIDGFDKDRKSKIISLREQLLGEEATLSKIEMPDIDKLKAKWNAMSKILERLNQYELKRTTLSENIIKLSNSISVNSSAIAKLQNRLKTAKVYDIDALILEHSNNANIKSATSSLALQIKEKEKSIMEKEAKLDNIRESIDTWHKEAGTICPHCKQKITGEYIEQTCAPLMEESSKIESLIAGMRDEVSKLQIEYDSIPQPTSPISVDEANEINSSISVMQDELDRLIELNGAHEQQISSNTSEVSSISLLVERVGKQANEHKPTMTIDEAMKIDSYRKTIETNIASIKDKMSTLEKQDNPHIQSMQLIDKQIDEATNSLKNLEIVRSKLHTLFSHIDYIRAAYKDRNKIKQYILSNLIPILNKRIQYYLDAFDCEFAMEFTPALSVLPSKWDYQLCSGGERKRIDMAMMFALYDLYIVMYGQQCNIMVLDEVDGRLDADGIEAFINIVNNDFNGSDTKGQKPDTILIISHRPEMLDAFPSKILVRKSEGFSLIESAV